MNSNFSASTPSSIVPWMRTFLDFSSLNLGPASLVNGQLRKRAHKRRPQVTFLAHVQWPEQRQPGCGPRRGFRAWTCLLAAAASGRRLEYVSPVWGAQWGGSVRNAVGPVVPDLGGGVHWSSGATRHSRPGYPVQAAGSRHVALAGGREILKVAARSGLVLASSRPPQIPESSSSWFPWKIAGRPPGLSAWPRDE